MNKRVIAIHSAKDGIIKFFGEGIYVGDKPHPEMGFDNPCIELDNGKIVWGCECWWGDAEKTKEKFPSDKWKWILVDIDEIRKSG